MPSSFPKPPTWFIAGVVVVLIVPIVKVLVDYQTFIHPWRPELTSAALLLVALGLAFRDARFRAFLEQLPSKELRLIIFPCVAFIFWSLVSATWARSAAFAIYHTSIWISYLAFYALFRYYIRDETSVNAWMIGLIVFLWIICLPPLIEYYAFAVTGNPTTITVRYSKYTELANTIVPLIIAYALQAKGRTAALGFATVMLVWLFDIGTMSRTGIGIFVLVILSMVVFACIVPALKQFRTRTAGLAAGLGLITLISSGALILTVGTVPAVDRASSQSSVQSNQTRVLLVQIAREMWSARPMTGIGADNYGLEFSNYRERYAEHAPNDQNLRFADDQLAERAHNEYLQILAELGTIGIALFTIFLLGIAYTGYYIWRSRADISVNAVAGLVGVGAFLASSLVTSYSFRIFQNGLAFFFVLAITIGWSLGRHNTGEDLAKSRLTWPVSSIAIAASLIASLFLAGYCLMRVAAVHEMLAGTASEDPAARSMHLNRAIALDPENALVYRAVWSPALAEGDGKTAAEYIRKSIDHGQTTTSDYSYLATAEILNGNIPAATAAIEKALKQYPLSTFLRSRYAVLLEMEGRPADAEQQFAIASRLDSGQAATWRVFLESGAAKASKFAYDTNGVKVMDLMPKNAIYAIFTERDLRFPGEKTDIPF